MTLRIVSLVLLIIALFGSSYSPVYAKSPDEQVPTQNSAPGKFDEQFVVGKVKSVTGTVVNKGLLKATGMVSNRQLAQVEVLEGPFKGLVTTVINEVTDNPAYNVILRPEQEVILCITTESGVKPEVNIADYHRAPALTWLAIIFLAVFLVLGGKKGFQSLAGLIVTVGLIALILLPLSLRGFNPLLTAAFICITAATTTMLFIGGFSKKTAAALIGTTGGVIVAGIAAELVILAAPLTGLSSEEAQILRGSVLRAKPAFFAGLLAAGMLIGALGVIMDIGISIASSVQEVANNNSSLSARALYISGMNVGKDIMGTMTNTLILAYAGAALPLLLLATQIPLGKLLNLDLVATEVASALSGSLGLVLTIPLTALASSKLMATTANPFVSAEDLSQNSLLSKQTDVLNHRSTPK